MSKTRNSHGAPVAKKRRTHLSVDAVKEASKESPESNTQPNDDDNFADKLKKRSAKFRLKATGEIASLSVCSDERVPILLTDVQHLLLHSLFGNINLSQPPRWYVLDKCGHITQTTCLILEGISVKNLENTIEKLAYLKSSFSECVEVLTPSVYNGSLVQELALVPLSDAEKESIIQKYGSMNLALEVRKDLMVMMRAVFPIGDGVQTNKDFKTEDKFPRTQLLLSAWQLIDENYPVPLKGKLKNAYSDYVMTKDEYMPVTANSPLFGLDCEMCMTVAGLELTRVSIVNENHETVYEALVKPYNNIVDYLTRYSGITKELLNDVSKRIEDVQNELRELLPPDAILVGQSLNSDLHALKMMHPYIIDTSLVYNFAGERARKPKLKALAKEFLNESIQSGEGGHCSVEDSIASLKLVQLKLTKELEFGDAVHMNRQKYKENVINMIQSPQYTISIFNRMMEHKKSSLIIGCDDITGDYHTYLSQAKENVSKLKKTKPNKIKLSTVDTVEQVISTLCSSISEYNLTMAHLKLDVSAENESEQMEKVDKWIQTIWKSLEKSSLFVIILGGSMRDNGVAIVKVKIN